MGMSTKAFDHLIHTVYHILAFKILLFSRDALPFINRIQTKVGYKCACMAPNCLCVTIKMEYKQYDRSIIWRFYSWKCLTETQEDGIFPLELSGE